MYITYCVPTLIQNSDDMFKDLAREISTHFYEIKWMNEWTNEWMDEWIQ